MTAAPCEAGDRSPWRDALLAAALSTIDPVGTGGVVLRARPGPPRERWLATLRGLLPDDLPLRRVPANLPDGRLLGGLDLTATLKAGRPVAERGLLAETDGGMLLLAMAERLAPATAARLTATMDSGEVVVERDGLALRSPSRVGVVALDEGVAEDERPPPGLCERLAFHLDLDGIAAPDPEISPPSLEAVAAARARLAEVAVPDEVAEGLCAAAQALGVASLRAPLLALRAARAAAALFGRPQAGAEDAALAGRLVLAPRATRYPQDAAAPDEADDPDAEAPSDGTDDDTPDADAGGQLRETVVAASAAAIPPGLLARLRLMQRARGRAATAGRAGARQLGAGRGRPVGVRRGQPRRGERLNVVETLRAAAPWQPLRRDSARRPADNGAPARVEVRPDDFRLTRRKQRRETTTIFVVDASGSAALHRLAEAKGAVELLLADCYVRRDQVALIAFRGQGAELALPPTRSLVRAKRSLAGLPGGGGTPLAAAIDAAAALAEATGRKGRTPVVVFLTDGRANVARDGTPGRARAGEEALAAARRLRAAGVAALLVDTAPRPQPQAESLAAEMAAQYLPLPHADAAALSLAVRAGAAERAVAGAG